MKDSDVPELAYAWWKKNQPVTLPSTGLGEALKAYEAARATAKPTKDVKAVDDCVAAYDTALSALADLTPAVTKAQAKCNKVLHATCLRVLGKYPGVITKERTALENERKEVAALLSGAVETCKVECAKVISAIIDHVKRIESKLNELKDIETEAGETQEDAAKAVASEEPNAGELEVTIAEGHLRDGTRVLNELRKLVDNARKETQKAWDEVYDRKLSKLDPQIGRLADRAEQQSASFDLALEKGDDAFKTIQSAAKTVRELADGVGDREAQFVSVCRNLDARTGKALEGITSRFAEAGGQLDRVKFNIMNFSTEGHRDYAKKEVLEEARISLKRGLELLAQGKKDLAQSRGGFVKGISALPEFAIPKNPKFKAVFADLAKTQVVLSKREQESRRLAESAQKETERFKEAMKLEGAL
ncbi:MAG: hypothetical protein HIU82_09370 [Proteobacteria bacterium]|nr:hypothetical protein [Pseudomonadota bacterium]